MLVLKTTTIVVTVARKKSLFDDKSEEIQQLTFIIKQDIGSLNKQIAQLQEVYMNFVCTQQSNKCYIWCWKFGILLSGNYNQENVWNYVIATITLEHCISILYSEQVITLLFFVFQLSRATRGHSGKHKQTHSNSVVVGLQSKLASMSNDFKSVLEVRTEVRNVVSYFITRVYIIYYICIIYVYTDCTS